MTRKHERVRGQCQNLKWTVCQGPAAPASCLLRSGRPLHCQLSHVAKRVSSPAPLRVLALSLLVFASPPSGFPVVGAGIPLAVAPSGLRGGNESSLDAGEAQQAKIPLVQLPEPKVIPMAGHWRRSPTTQRQCAFCSAMLTSFDFGSPLVLRRRFPPFGTPCVHFVPWLLRNKSSFLFIRLSFACVSRNWVLVCIAPNTVPPLNSSLQ